MKLPTLCLTLLLTGCAHDPLSVSKGHGHVDAGATTKLSVGMTKEQVVSRFGKPLNVEASGGAETLYYIEERPWWNWVEISVVIERGLVTGYGDTRYIRTTKQIIEVVRPQ